MTSLIPQQRSALAASYFEQGYNCAQAVVLAFADITGQDAPLLARLSAPFGGGMSRMREVCGAVSGGMTVIGALYGYATPETGEAKARLYAIGQSYARRFSEILGALRCSDLLHRPAGADGPTPTPRTAEAFHGRPCKEIVATAASVLAQVLNENPA